MAIFESRMIVYGIGVDFLTFLGSKSISPVGGSKFRTLLGDFRARKSSICRLLFLSLHSDMWSLNMIPCCFGKEFQTRVKLGCKRFPEGRLLSQALELCLT